VTVDDIARVLVWANGGDPAEIAAAPSSVLVMDDAQQCLEDMSIPSGEVRIAVALRLPVAGTTLFNVSDPRALSAAELATMIAEVAGAPPPRHLPEWGARGAAAMGDLFARVTGLKIPFSSARLRANLESSEYPCRRLSAAGFVHPHSTREGLAELVEWVRRDGQA
jgi:nucleoside-diphosphate-sugar epimerase